MSIGPTKIAIDVMGADLGLREVIEGVKLVLEKVPEKGKLVLVGDEILIEDTLRDCGMNGDSRIGLQHASRVIGMDEKPIQSLKEKKDSSMVRAIELVRDGEVQAMVSCGNTGSLMAGGTIKLRPMAGVSRPALSTVIPSKDHRLILIDAGANLDSSSNQMLQNAILGSNHCKVELGVNRPKVGLLTIGTEEGKGTERIHETHRMLKSIDSIINYTGLIEGFHVFEKDVDVVVCDGFVGNVLIKTCESLFHTLKRVVYEELTQNPWRKLGALISSGAYRSIKRQFNPDNYGWALLLGLKGTILKAHGSSNRVVVSRAIGSALKIAQYEMNEHIQGDLEEAERLLKPSDVEAEVA